MDSTVTTTKELEDRFRALLKQASALLETRPGPGSDLKQALGTRLSEYYQQTGNEAGSEHLRHLQTVEDVQIQTAKEASRLLNEAQRILDPPAPIEPPPLGSRDLTKLRTLLSLVFRWGLEHLNNRLSGGWSVRRSIDRAQIIDLTNQNREQELYITLVRELFWLIFPDGADGRVGQSMLTTSLLQLHGPEMLISGIILGWMPHAAELADPTFKNEFRPLIGRFLRMLTSTQAMSALAQVLSSQQQLPAFLRKVCGNLLTKQLLRNDGVHGLFESILGDEQGAGEEIGMDKMEHIARILLTVPAAMDPKTYFELIIPRLLKFLSNKVPPTYRRSAAFVLYRAVSGNKSKTSQAMASTVTLSTLHKPFHTTHLDSLEEASRLRPRDAVVCIASLISNAEPVPEFISSLLSPIVSDLYMLLFDLERVRTADPELRELISCVLVSWGKIVDKEEAERLLWLIIKGEKEGEWRYTIEGKIWKSASRSETSSLSLLTPKDLKKMNEEENSAEMNLFDLYPDPAHFVKFLKSLEREDVSSLLFVKLLQDYRYMKTHANQEPTRVLNELQLIMQMQAQMTEGDKSNILRKPDHLLTFILHVLQSSKITVPGEPIPRRTQEDMEDGDSDDEGLEPDSDDDAPDSEVIGPDDELIETAITLLLSILEAHETLPQKIFPVLNEIFNTLEKLAFHGRPTLMALAREARLVTTARLANETQAKSKYGDEVEESIRDTYQKALKLLQDPILPVRAHGLLLLRQVVTPSKQSPKEMALVQALLPSILSIFRQSVQDGDSYIFLNAVQGLSALVDTFGKDVLRGLVHDYSDGLAGLGAGNLSQQDLDVRIRVGEALGTTIKRCGSALGIYIDLIVPPLFAIVRSKDAPVAIRSSALSLLGECVDTYPLAVLPYLEDLGEGMLDLIQLEGVFVTPEQIQKTKEQAVREEKEKEEAEKKKKKFDDDEDMVQAPAKPSLDSDPTSTNAKLPPLRRAAIHFFALMIRSTIRDAYDQVVGFSAPTRMIQRARNTLGYVASADEDMMVRIMARETVELMDQMQRALLGVD